MQGEQSIIPSNWQPVFDVLSKDQARFESVLRLGKEAWEECKPDLDQLMGKYFQLFEDIEGIKSMASLHSLPFKSAEALGEVQGNWPDLEADQRVRIITAFGRFASTIGPAMLLETHRASSQALVDVARQCGEASALLDFLIELDANGAHLVHPRVARMMSDYYQIENEILRSMKAISNLDGDTPDVAVRQYLSVYHVAAERGYGTYLHLLFDLLVDKKPKETPSLGVLFRRVESEIIGKYPSHQLLIDERVHKWRNAVAHRNIVDNLRAQTFTLVDRKWSETISLDLATRRLHALLGLVGPGGALRKACDGFCSWKLLQDDAYWRESALEVAGLFVAMERVILRGEWRTTGDVHLLMEELSDADEFDEFEDLLEEFGEERVLSDLFSGNAGSDPTLRSELQEMRTRKQTTGADNFTDPSAAH